jgi:hypothetical protein
MLYAGLAAMVVAASTGCCGPCGQNVGCGWYPGKHLGRIFSCGGCGQTYYGGWDGGDCCGGCEGGGGGGCCGGGGYDGGDYHPGWAPPGDVVHPIHTAPAGPGGPIYYPSSVEPAPAAPRPPRQSTTRTSATNRNVRQVGYTQQPTGYPPQKHSCTNSQCPCSNN